MSLFRKQDEKAVISCTYDDNNLDVMLWYQQLHNSKSLALIVYSYGSAEPSYESGFKKRFSLTKNDTTIGALIIYNLTVIDSGVYYCAAKRHSVIFSITYLTKNLSIKTGNGTISVVFVFKITV